MLYNQSILTQWGTIQPVAPGFYESPFPFNFHLVLKDSGFNLNFNDEYFQIGDIHSYGVCDNPQQVLDKCPELISSKDVFILSCDRLIKKEQSSEGGWRWHKWGEYIGTQEPTTEYLYDEPLIEEVFCYHIYRLRAVS